MRAQGPDGTMFDFPDGTAETVISRTIRDHYAGAGGQTVTPQQAQAELARRELSRRDRARQTTQMTPMDWGMALNPMTTGAWALERLSRTDGRMGAAAAGFRDAMSFGGADELAGVGAGLQAMTRGQPYMPAYRQATDTDRENLAAQQEARPYATGAGQIAGFLAPGVGITGLVTRGGRVATRIGASAATGAASGAASGALTGVTPEERQQGAVVGGVGGAALGAGAHAVLGEALPAAWNAGRRWYSGATGAPVVSGRMGIAESARSDLMSTARQNQSLGIQNEDDLIRVMQEAQARDPTLTVAEVLGQPGQGRLAALARAPGATGQRVEEFFTQRARNQPDDVAAAVLGRAPASGDELEQAVREQWRTRGTELYQPLLTQPFRGGEAGAYRALRSSPLFQHRAVQAAWRQSGAMIADDVALGRLPAEAAQSLRHRLHYTKVALDDMVADPTTLPSGLRAMNNASISQAARQFADRLEGVIPGYTRARGEMADIGAARRAIEMGRQAFTRQRFASPQALARHMQSLTPGERPYFIAGVEDSLANMIMAAGRDGRRNVASSLLSDQTQARLRSVFGAEADGMIARLRQISDRFDFGQRVRPTQGSITSNVLLQAGPGIGGAGLGAANAQDDPIMGAITGGAIGFGLQAAARRAASSELVRRMNRGGEAQRDLLGRVYLTQVGDAPRMTGGLLSRARREETRQRERARLERTRAAYVAGLGAAGLYEPEHAGGY